METNLLSLLKSISFEGFAIGIIVFLLTLIIKLPIKKITAKFTEVKRKQLNSFIILIPVILSFVFAYLYYGLICKEWLNIQFFNLAIDAWIIAFLVYVICERIYIIAKGVKLGKEESRQDNLQSEFNSKDIAEILKQLNNKENKILSLSEKMDYLINAKDELKIDEGVDSNSCENADENKK